MINRIREKLRALGILAPEHQTPTQRFGFDPQLARRMANAEKETAELGERLAMIRRTYVCMKCKEDCQGRCYG